MLRAIARKVGAYGLNVLISLDQLLNTICLGDPDETISSRVGKIRERHGGNIPWTSPVAKIIDRTCEIFDKNHTLEAIEYDEGETMNPPESPPMRCCVYCQHCQLMDFDGLTAPCQRPKNVTSMRAVFVEPFFVCQSFEPRSISPRMEN